MPPRAAAVTLTLLLLAAVTGCSAPPVSDRDGATVASVEVDVDERLVQIEVLVRALSTDRTGRDRRNEMRPREGVRVTLTGPRGTELEERANTGADGRARFELARSLSRLYALRPGTYTVRVEGIAEPEEVQLPANRLNRLIIAGEQRLLERTGPSVGTPRAIVDASFHPPERPGDDRDLITAPPRSGDTIELSVTARSVGDGPLYRLTGTVDARGPAAERRTADPAAANASGDTARWFLPVELEFGQLEVGESATLVLPVTIPRSANGGPLDVVVSWAEHNGHAPDNTAVQLPPIEPVATPVVGVDLFFTDPSGRAVDRLAVPAGTPIELTVRVTHQGGGEPGRLVLRVQSESGEALTIARAEATAAFDPGADTLEIGPVALTLNGDVGRLRLKLIEDDFGVISEDVPSLRSAQEDR